MKHSTKIWACIALVALASGCKDKDEPKYQHTNTNTTSQSNTAGPANEFVYDVMSTYYYWVDEMPNINYQRETDTEKYFYKLLSDKDRFSFISNDANATLDEFDGITTSMGWDYTLSRWGNAQQVVAIVNYVFPNTPAAEAGVRRGDIIYSVNGNKMTTNNYSSVFNVKSGKFSAWRYEEGKESATNIEFSLKSAQVTEDYLPVTNIFTLEDGTKVGYVLYYSYSTAFDQKLEETMKNMQDAQIDELILDLRYNTGGDMISLCKMCSLLGPNANVMAKDELLFYDYNKLLTKEAPEEYSREASHLVFCDTLGVDLGLKRLFVLTGANTYSASEATIWALKPYMDVVLVGETSGGKNSMMYVMTPSDFVEVETGKPYYSSSINNWLIAPIVAVYKNCTGETFDTSKGYGLAPDIEVDEMADLTKGGLKELGDKDEVLVVTVLKFLAGETTSENKSATLVPQKISSSAANRLGGLRIRKSKR